MYTGRVKSWNKVRLSLALILAFCGTGLAAEARPLLKEDKLLTLPWVRRVGVDIVHLPSVIVHWSREDRLIAGGVAAATAIAYTADGNGREDFHGSKADIWGNISHNFTHFGDYQYQVPVIGAFWAGGYLTGNATSTRIAGDAAEASFIAAGVINPLIAWVTGRNLPNKNDPKNQWDFFEPHHYSFPSGHTAAAFALASVLDNDLRDEFGHWQTPVVYGVATAVGVSRVYDLKHYYSDVILGGSIGWAVGTWVSRGRKGYDQTLTLSPTPGGVRLAWKF